MDQIGRGESSAHERLTQGRIIALVDGSGKIYRDDSFKWKSENRIGRPIAKMIKINDCNEGSGIVK